MSQAKRNRLKALRREKRKQTDSEGLRYGTLANRIRKGKVMALSWWKGPAKFVKLSAYTDKSGVRTAHQPSKSRPIVPPYSKRWKRARVVRRPPKIVSVLGALFG